MVGWMDHDSGICVLLRVDGSAVDAREEHLDAGIFVAERVVCIAGAMDTLDALVELLGERARDALHKNDASAAAAASKGVDAVLQAQTWTETNVSPQLIASKLIRELSTTLK